MIINEDDDNHYCNDRGDVYKNNSNVVDDYDENNGSGDDNGYDSDDGSNADDVNGGVCGISDDDNKDKGISPVFCPVSTLKKTLKKSHDWGPVWLFSPGMYKHVRTRYWKHHNKSPLN